MRDVLRRFSMDDIATYEHWFSDGETARRVAAPDAVWRGHALHGPLCECWALDEEEILAAMLQAEWSDEQRRHAFVAVVVDPARRGRGLGTRILKAYLASVPGASVEARVEPDNLPSLALVRRCGFRSFLEVVGQDGLLPFLHERARMP